MDAETFELKMMQLCDGLPDEIAAFISSYAWEHSHSGGAEEVYNTALGVKEDLKDVIKLVQKVVHK